MTLFRLLIIGLIFSFAGEVCAQPRVRGEPAANLRRIETKYYILHTDLSPEQALEVEVRMTRMAEEYHNRTKEFSGRITEQLPFYLFTSQKDYIAAGGDPRSAGIFNGERLMAIAGKQTGWGTWHTVQHEGFHQFAHSVIGGNMPIWVNEGLAEYFGEMVFTGDGYQAGLIPQFRLVRIRQMIREKKSKSIKEMMLLSHDRWNEDLQLENYDQVWSMVHFLVHADDGKYRQAFAEFIKLVGKNRTWEQAWKQTFGDIIGFEQKWSEYWLGLPDDPTSTEYGQASVATLTSFLSRTTAEGQQFKNFQDFARMGRAKQLKMTQGDVLPAGVFIEMLDLGAELGTWKLDPSRNNSPTLTLQLKTGPKINGSFKLRPARQIVTEVTGEKKPAGLRR